MLLLGINSYNVGILLPMVTIQGFGKTDCSNAHNEKLREAPLERKAGWQQV